MPRGNTCPIDVKGRGKWKWGLGQERDKTKVEGKGAKKPKIEKTKEAVES